MSFFKSNRDQSPVATAARGAEPAPSFNSKFRGLRIKELREKKNALAAEMQTHLDENESKWNDEHEAKHKSMAGDLSAMASMIAAREGAGEHINHGQFSPGEKTGYSVLVDSTGARHYAVGKNQKLSSVPAFAGQHPADCQHPVGEFLRAIVGGVSDGTPPSIAAAMGSGTATSAGYILPSALASQVIDLARAKSVLVDAGLQTIGLSGASLDLAKITGEPAMSVKFENERFPEDAITLGRITIVPKLIGVLVRSSRELIEDSANFAAIVEETLMRALAAAIDNLGVNGSGVGQNPCGILNQDGIAVTDTVGALTWAKLALGAKAVRLRNHEPNAALLSVNNSHSLGMSVDLQNRWLDAPPVLRGVTGLDSTSVPDDKAVVGDFSRFALGLRQAASIEVTETGDEAFSRHQVLFKVWFRGDFACLDASAFQILDDITQPV